MFTTIFKDVFPILDLAAPLISKTLKFPGFTQTKVWALDLLGKKFGVGDDIEKLTHAIQTDPQSQDKLESINEAFCSLIMKAQKEIAISNAKINIEVNFDNKNEGVVNAT